MATKEEGFKEVLLEHPETKSLMYASDPTQLGNLIAIGWSIHEGKKNEFKPGKDVPFGSNTEIGAPASEDVESLEPVVIDSASTDSK